LIDPPPSHSIEIPFIYEIEGLMEGIWFESFERKPMQIISS
jgi:hypothetical protein